MSQTRRGGLCPLKIVKRGFEYFSQSVVALYLKTYWRNDVDENYQHSWP